jgi:hypothetical protein
VEQEEPIAVVVAADGESFLYAPFFVDVSLVRACKHSNKLANIKICGKIQNNFNQHRTFILYAIFHPE